MALATGQPAATASNVMVFSISFSSSVTGVVANDFALEEGDLAITRALSGSGTEYTLTLTVTGGDTSAGVALTVGLAARTGSISPPNAVAAATATVKWSFPRRPIAREGRTGRSTWEGG